MKFHSAITFCSERVERSAHTGFLSTSQELSPLMIRKIIRLAAKKISEVVRATLDDFRDIHNIQAITYILHAFRVATFLPLTV